MRASILSGAALAGLVMLSSAPATSRSAAPVRPATAPYRWHNVTVGGGGFAPGLVFSTVERGLAYLRTDMGGAYRWDVRAGRWLPLQDGNAVPSYMGIESIAPDPMRADVVYLAAGMGGDQPAAIWRSADRGVHWTIMPVPFAMGGNEDGRGLGERLAIDPHHPATLFFGSRHDGLWRSRDRGAHWAKVTSFPLPGLGRPTERRRTHGGLAWVVFDPARPGRLFVGSADPGPRHLFRSDDAGATWQTVPGGPVPDLLPVKAVLGRDAVLTIAYDDGIGPNGITRGAVWRLDTGTARWEDVTPDRRPDAPAGGYMGLAVSRQDPRVIAVATVDRYKPVDTVWRSVDGGRHWDELWRRSSRYVAATPFLKLDGDAPDFGHWIAGLAIDPFDDGHAAYVTGATIYATKAFDGLGTMRWQPWTRGIEQTAIITLVSPTGGAPLVSGFGDIAGFRHDDLAVSPPRVHRNPYLTNTNTLDYAGRAPAVMVRSGSAHTRVVPGATLAWSDDGGGRWRPLVPPPGTAPTNGSPPPIATGDAAIAVSADGSTMLAAATPPVLTRTRGRTWIGVAGLPVRTRVTADKVDPARFYAIDANAGHVLRSDDGGATFRPVAGAGLPADLSGARDPQREAPNPLVAVPGEAGHLWLLLDGALYRSTDAGERWARAPGALRVGLYGLGRGAPGARWPALYAVGTLRGLDAVWRSDDGGARWVRVNDDRHRWGMRFRVIAGDPRRYGRVYIGTDGRGILYGDPRGER